MANPLAKIESVAVSVEKKIVVVAEDVIHVGSDLFKLLGDAQKLSPAFKAELATLIADASPIAVALAPIVAQEGTNVTADLAAIAVVLPALKKFVADFISFVPTIKLAIAEIQADVK